LETDVNDVLSSGASPPDFLGTVNRIVPAPAGRLAEIGRAFF
jgi:hypothetical protein